MAPFTANDDDEEEYDVEKNDGNDNVFFTLYTISNIFRKKQNLGWVIFF